MSLEEFASPHVVRNYLLHCTESSEFPLLEAEVGSSQLFSPLTSISDGASPFLGQKELADVYGHAMYRLFHF